MANGSAQHQLQWWHVSISLVERTARRRRGTSIRLSVLALQGQREGELDESASGPRIRAHYGRAGGHVGAARRVARLDGDVVPVAVDEAGALQAVRDIVDGLVDGDIVEMELQRRAAGSVDGLRSRRGLQRLAGGTAVFTIKAREGCISGVSLLDGTFG